MCSDPCSDPKIGTRLSSYKVMAIEAASLFQGSAILLFCQAIFQNVWRVLKLCEVATGLPYLNIWSMHETSLHGNSNFFLRWKPSRLSQKNRKVPVCSSDMLLAWCKHFKHIPKNQKHDEDTSAVKFFPKVSLGGDSGPQWPQGLSLQDF